MSLVSGIQYSTEITGRRNAIINGNFDIWQRATSQTGLLYGSADRFGIYHAGTSVTQTMSQQPFTVGQTDVPYSPQYYVRHVVTAGTDVATQARMFQGIEGVRNYAGETVTISFWAKTSASQEISLMIYQGFGTGGSPSVEVTTALDKVTTTTSWAKYSVTAVIPSISGKTLGTNGDDQSSINFWFSAGSNNDADASSIGIQTGTFELAQIQFEAGDVATEFERRTIGEELALCQRYYQTINYPAFFSIGFGRGTGTTIARTEIKQLAVPMRATPVGNTSTSGDIGVYRVGTEVDVSTAENVSAVGTTYNSWYANVSITTPGANLSYRIYTTGTAWTATFDAEI